MENGCKLSNNSLKKCLKFDIICDGKIPDKKQCPIWGEILVLEDYYDAKYRMERALA